RLGDRFRLLTGGSRIAVPRQQTLRGLIDWSYDLLSEAERALLRRLSVFAGGWALEAAEAICAGEGEDADEVLDLLSQLVNKSLVQAEKQGKAERFRLLETIRQYAREKLLGAGEAQALRERHLAFFLAQAELALSNKGRDDARWLARLGIEHDNLRAALEGSTEGGAGKRGLQLAGAPPHFFVLPRPPTPTPP